MNKWLITGANGNLGTRLIADLLSNGGNEVVAVVRSERAAQRVRGLVSGGLTGRLQVEVLDYADEEALRSVAVGCQQAVHLVGILKATAAASYVAAHEESCTALTRALAGSTVAHLTYLSIVGSSPGASNTCLASKGRAEQICLQGALPCAVLRVPMVLGEGDYASFALRKRASSSISFTFRAASLEQPIYAGDVVQAIRAAADQTLTGVVDLGGPEVLTRRSLTQRAGAVLGFSPKLISLPMGLGLLMAGVLEKISDNPPVTRAMLEVLDHDDQIDPAPALQTLGISRLTALDDMLSRVLKSEA